MIHLQMRKKYEHKYQKLPPNSIGNILWYIVKKEFFICRLPSVELPRGKLVQSVLETRNVYILDCSADVYVW